ncbi:hypothetical protein EYF80_009441 [Liparis tanakae]|uniref:Uncharacterized protein n=1 Tax=Liparis tanakae TaxID=230148 RepID=A0A4Z2IRM1_9TELE|nr:hypothetical protein EYF80_009441 [Liparis tanakae]
MPWSNRGLSTSRPLIRHVALPISHRSSPSSLPSFTSCCMHDSLNRRNPPGRHVAEHQWRAVTPRTKGLPRERERGRGCVWEMLEVEEDGYSQKATTGDIEPGSVQRQ